MNEDLDKLMKIKDSLDNENLMAVVDSARVKNPSTEIEGALTDFLTGRLSRLEQDAQFADLIKMHLRQRFPEFTIEQLMQLNEQVTRNNNKAVEVIMPLFQGDTAGKIVTEHLRDSSTETAAKKLYDTADKDMLQALSYFSSAIERAVQQKNSTAEVVEAEVIENN